MCPAIFNWATGSPNIYPNSTAICCISCSKSAASLRLRLVDSLQQEVTTIRAEVERRRSETEDMKMKAADATGQIKILREQLKLKRNGFK